VVHHYPPMPIPAETLPPALVVVPAWVPPLSPDGVKWGVRPTATSRGYEGLLPPDESASQGSEETVHELGTAGFIANNAVAVGEYEYYELRLEASKDRYAVNVVVVLYQYARVVVVRYSGAAARYAKYVAGAAGRLAELALVAGRDARG